MIDSDKIYVIDDFLPDIYQNNVMYKILRDIPYTFCFDITNDYLLDRNDNKLNYGFSCNIKNPNTKQSPIVEVTFSYAMPIFDIGFDMVGAGIKELHAMRSFMLYPSELNVPRTEPHVDSRDEHWVGLYYVNGSDGNTIIFNETSDDFPEEYPTLDQVTIKEEVEPKKGRLVIFHGKHFHCMCPPTKDVRTVININVDIGEIQCL